MLINRNSRNESDKCSNPSCSKKFKKGCARNMCQRCCFRIKNASIRSSSASSSSTLSSSRQDTSQNIVQLDNITCNVHKDKSFNAVETTPKTDSISYEDSTQINPLSTQINNLERVPFTSKCRVLLVGIGADEQLAGYSRHRTVSRFYRLNLYLFL